MGQVTHKMTYSKVYRTWVAMRSRCRNPNDPNYINYGARGIKVCAEWEKFENFYEDMGGLPFYEAQLDRIDNEKGYYKDNCRWLSAKENSRNRRTTKRHKTHLGNLVQIELMEKIGWTRDQMRWYLKRYGANWVLENFKNGTLPVRVNKEINRHDIEKKSFGKWLVINFHHYTKKEGHMYFCRCECGFESLIPRNNLMKCKSKGCRSCANKRSK